MSAQQPFVKKLCDGGAGSEASVTVQLRNTFPGIGGLIKTEQAVVTALRASYSNIIGLGDKLFLRHTIFKKLDDYFLKSDKYFFQHITRPLGSIEKNGASEGYLYEWVYGADTFPWEYSQPHSNPIMVQLDEWSSFISAFSNAGINVGIDVTDADDGRMSQNIVHQLYKVTDYKLNACWKRIDFGDVSISINPEKLKVFLTTNEDSLIDSLELDRYELIVLAYKFLYENKQMTEKDFGRLEILARLYRVSSLRHKIAEHIIT